MLELETLTPHEKEWCNEQSLYFSVDIKAVEYALVSADHDKATCVESIRTCTKRGIDIYAFWDAVKKRSC